MSAHLTHYFPEAAFGGFADVDGTVAFYSRVNALVRPDSAVADFGCGRGCHAEDQVAFRRDLRSLKGKVARVIGLDIDPAAQENPFLDEFRPLVPGASWPLADAEVGLIVADCVLEHLPDPPAFFREARRVLRPGGYLCIRTANVRSYIGLASKLIPNRLHARVLAKAQSARKPEDVFPALYRCNTLGAVRLQMRRHGFRAAVYGYEGEPYYLSFSRLAYALGVLYRRLAPAAFLPAIFAFGQLQ